MVASTALLLMLVACLFLSGCCTGIGYVVGEALDKHNAATDTIHLENVPILKMGQAVTILTEEDTVLSGPIFATRNIKLAEYQAYYTNWRLTHQDYPFSPRIGDTLIVVHRPDSGGYGETAHSKFVGLTANAILLEGSQSGDTFSPDGIKSMPLRSVDEVFFGRVNSIAGDSISSLLCSHLVPVTTSLVIGVTGDTITLPWNKAKRLTTTITPSLGKTIGIVAGAVLDITALVITLENLSRTRIGGTGWHIHIKL